MGLKHAEPSPHVDVVLVDLDGDCLSNDRRAVRPIDVLE